MPIAGGVALGSWLRKSDQVTVCFFGDGASNQGVFTGPHRAIGGFFALAVPLRSCVAVVLQSLQYAD